MVELSQKERSGGSSYIDDWWVFVYDFVFGFSGDFAVKHKDGGLERENVANVTVIKLFRIQ